MGNYITTESSEQKSTAEWSTSCMTTVVSWYTSCMEHTINISVTETPHNKETKDKYETYTDEIAVSPKHQGPINLELVYHHCTSENTPVYGYENLKRLVKILRVIDGDTLDIALHHEDSEKIFKHRVRMYGLDTPEMHPSLSNPERNKEIEAAKKAKDALIQRIQENDYLIVALFHKFDKYGRLMATLYDKQGEDINKWMIESGYAQEYFGKTKKKFEEPKTLMVSECDLEYFETPRKNEPTSEPASKAASEPEEDFEELSAEVEEEIKNEIRIVA